MSVCSKLLFPSSYLNVIAFFLASKIGLSSLSNPVRTGCSANSGSSSSTLSSKAIRPRSTTSSAATAVKSFVCDASKKTASSCTSAAPSSTEVLPAAWLYSKLPVNHRSNVSAAWPDTIRSPISLVYSDYHVPSLVAANTTACGTLPSPTAAASSLSSEEDIFAATIFARSGMNVYMIRRKAR